MILYIALNCPGCRRRLRVRTEYFGTRVFCQYCNHGFLVPIDDDAPAVTKDLAGNETTILQEIKMGFDQEIKRLRGELTRRSSDHETATLQLEESRQEIGRLRSTLEDERKQLDQSRDQAREAEGRLKQLQETHADLEQLRTRAEALRERQANQWEQELQLSREEIARLQAERETCRATHCIDQVTAEATAQELETVRSQRDQLQGELQHISDELAARRADSERLKDLATENQQLQTESDELRCRIVKLEDCIAEAEATQSSTARALEEMKQDWHKQRDEFQMVVEQLRRERDDLAGRYREVEAAHQGAIDRLQAEIGELNTSLTEAEQRQLTAEERQHELHGEIRTLWTQRDKQHDREVDLRRTVVTLENDQKAARADVAEHHRTAQKLEQAQKELQLEVAGLRQERDRLAGQVQEAEAARSEIDAGLQTERERLAEERDRAVQQEQETRQQNQSICSQKEELTRQLDGLREDLDRQRELAGELKLQLTTAEQSLKDASSAARAERERLNRALGDAQNRDTQEQDEWERRLDDAHQQFEQERSALMRQIQEFEDKDAVLKHMLKSFGVKVG